MIVSLLQLMGFPMAKPVHSRAVDASGANGVQSPVRAQSVNEQTKTSSARRSDVKATSKKSGKGVEKAQPAAKPVAKPPKKAAPAAKAEKAVKAEKPVKSEKPVKTAAPLQSEKLAKLAESAVPKVVKKSAEKPVAKAPVQSEPPAEVIKIESVVAAPATQRAGRPSARLAQLTVPSMAQSVASTAAKASYSSSIPSTVIAPPLSSSIKKDAKLANNWKTKPVAELTDADLLAMSDDDYMNEVQLAAFRLKLQALRQSILNSAGETTEHLREDTSVVPDPADRATIEEEHALELRTRDRERKLLKKIEQSIARIDAGDYGYCDETGEPIGVGRLLARPTATLSLEAQQRRELKQKMFGD